MAQKCLEDRGQVDETDGGGGGLKTRKNEEVSSLQQHQIDSGQMNPIDALEKCSAKKSGKIYPSGRMVVGFFYSGRRPLNGTQLPFYWQLDILARHCHFLKIQKFNLKKYFKMS